VHVGPGADADGVDVVGLHEFQPVVVDSGNLIFAGDGFAGRAAPVGYGHYLNAFLFSKAGYMPQAGVCAGADQPNANYSVLHSCPPGLNGTVSQSGIKSD